METKRYLQHDWIKAILIAITVTSIYLFMSSRTTLWDRDEPRFARAAMEMMESGHYLVPTFNGELRADKPVLVYWAMILAVHIFGVSEFAFRFFSAVGTGVCCLLIFYIGKRLLGPKEGLWAMLILATSALMLAIGTMATSDGLTLPLTLGAMAIFISAMTSGWRFYHILGIGILTGLGMLGKGPIGAMPYPVIVLTLWITRKGFQDFFKNFAAICIAAAIGIAIFLAWAIPANIETQGQFLNAFIGKHVINRALRPMEHHGGNLLLYLPYYIPVIIGGFFPWILMLPSALSAIFGKRLGQPLFRVVILTWTITIFILMSLAATKLPHYIIFIWPALSLATAGVIEAARQNILSRLDRQWLQKGVWFLGPMIFGGAGLLIIGSWFVPVKGLQIPAMMTGIIVLLMGFFAMIQHTRERLSNAAWILLAGMIAFQIPWFGGVIPVVEREIKTSSALADAINAATPADVPVADYKHDEPTVNFYVGRKITRLKTPQEAADWLKNDKPRVLIIPAGEMNSLSTELGPLPARRIFSKDGFNYSKGKKVQLQAWLNTPGTTTTP
jgi:4-amino-4-deoxy-L-arabinose transferase-like glycosyltransferase